MTENGFYTTEDGIPHSRPRGRTKTISKIKTASQEVYGHCLVIVKWNLP